MHFIYVMRDEDKNKLIELGYKLLKEDIRNNIWVFSNKNEHLYFSTSDDLSNNNISCIESSVLTF